MKRKPKQPIRARLRDIDKPLLATYGRRYHANRDFVTARVARNRRRLRRILMTLTVLLVLGTIGGWWYFSRSVNFTVATTPADARLTVTDAPRRAESAGESTGTLSVTDTAAGTYSVLVSRTGFATQTVTVDARRFSENTVSVTLQPLPQTLTVKAKPSSAKITVTDANGSVVAKASGTATATVPAGQVSVAVTAKGKEPYSDELLLDRPTTLKVSLDAK